MLTEIFDNKYQELLQAVRVRELAHCCDKFIKKREKQLSGRFTAPLATINPELINNSDLNLEVRQYQAVIKMQSALNTRNKNNTQKITVFSRIFSTCKSILDGPANSLYMQFIRKVLDLLPNTLASHFAFFRSDIRQLISNVENLTDEGVYKNQLFLT